MPGPSAATGSTGSTGRISWRPGDWPPEQLDARLTLLQERMAAAGYPVRVVSKTRTAEHQKRLYAQGRSAPGAIVTDKSGQPGDESRHQLGTAADFGFVSPRQNWDLLGQTAQELGLEWGGTLWDKQSPMVLNELTGALEPNSPDFIDKPHVQMPKRGQPQLGTRATGYTDPASVKVTGPTPAAPALAAAPMPPPAPPQPQVYTGVVGKDVNLPLEPPRTAARQIPDPTRGTIPRPDINLPLEPTPTPTPPAPRQARMIPDPTRGTIARPDVNLPLSSAAPPAPPASPSLPRLDSMTTITPSAIDDAVRRTQPTATPATAEGGTLRDYVNQMAARYQVPPELAFAIIERESKGVHATAGEITTSGKGARGMFQVRPETGKTYGLNVDDPLQNIEAGVRNLREGLDTHDNDPVSAAAYYFAGSNPALHGPATEEYAQAIGKRLLEMLHEREAGAATPTSTLPPQQQLPVVRPGGRPPPMGFFNSMVQGLDPNEIEGRRNIGGMIGGAVGGFAGSVVPVWGTAAGAAAGAGLGGFAEQLLVEETGLGKLIADWLPGSTDIPEPRRRARKTETAFDRADQVGMEQAIWDVVGQLTMGAGRWAVTRAMQNKVGEAAKTVFQDLKREAVAGLHADLNSLRTRGRELLTQRLRAKAGVDLGAVVGTRAAGAGAEAGTRAAAAAAEAAERQAAAEGAAEVERTALREGGQVGVAEQVVEDTELLGKLRGEGVRQTHADKVAAAREAVQARMVAAKEAEQAAIEASRRRFLEQQEAFVANETGAGAKAAEVFEGSAQGSLDKRGRAVEAAADAAKPVNIKPLQKEAERIATKELLPTAESLPRNALPDVEEAAEKAAEAMGKERPGQPNLFEAPVEEAAEATVPSTRLTQLAEDIGEARYRELVKHPAMGVIRRILNAKGKVPFKDLHLWKKELDDAIRHTFDKTQRKQVAALTLHIRNELRAALKVNEPYNLATAAYKRSVPTFRQGAAKTLRQVTAETVEPNTLVRRISVDRPREAQRLVEILTTHAEAGGREIAEQAARKARLSKKAIKEAGDKGAAAAAAEGREALDELRGQWIHRFVTEGTIDTLPERLAKLRARKEFVTAFLGDAEGQAALRKLDAAVAAHALTESVAKGATKTEISAARQAVKDARLARRSAVATQTANNRTATRLAADRLAARKATRDAAVEAARRAAQEKLTAAKDTGKSAVTAAKDAGEAAITAAKDVGRQAKTAVKDVGHAEKTANLEARQVKAEEIRVRKAGTEAERAFERSSLGRKLAGPEEAAGNIVNTLIFGPRGRGWWRALLGASSKDMQTYLKVIKTEMGGKHSSAAMQAAGKIYPLTTHWASPAGMDALLKSGATATTIPNPRRRRTSTPPPKPKPAEISMTIRP